MTPINFMEGLHRKTNRAWIRTAKLETEADFLNYIARLEALAAQVSISQGYYSTTSPD